MKNSSSSFMATLSKCVKIVFMFEGPSLSCWLLAVYCAVKVTLISTLLLTTSAETNSPAKTVDYQTSSGFFFGDTVYYRRSACWHSNLTKEN